jgi:DNA-binding GntR family transcriptional regulator
MEPFSRTYISVSRPGLDLHELTERHRPILTALESRDGARAEKAMHTHLIEAAELLRPVVEPDKEHT